MQHSWISQPKLLATRTISTYSAEMAVREAFANLQETAREVGLIINEDKIKFMVQIRRRNRLGQNVNIGDHNFEVVNNFSYLDSVLSADNDENREILYKGG